MTFSSYRSGYGYGCHFSYSLTRFIYRSICLFALIPNTFFVMCSNYTWWNDNITNLQYHIDLTTWISIVSNCGLRSLYPNHNSCIFSLGNQQLEPLCTMTTRLGVSGLLLVKCDRYIPLWDLIIFLGITSSQLGLSMSCLSFAFNMECHLHIYRFDSL